MDRYQYHLEGRTKSKPGQGGVAGPSRLTKEQAAELLRLDDLETI